MSDSDKLDKLYLSDKEPEPCPKCSRVMQVLPFLSCLEGNKVQYCKYCNPVFDFKICSIKDFSYIRFSEYR